VTDDEIQIGIAQAGEAVTRALASIAVSTTPAISLQASDLMIRIAMSFILNALGPAVARRELA
jgi:hypothetical protein